MSCSYVFFASVLLRWFYSLSFRSSLSLSLVVSRVLKARLWSPWVRAQRPCAYAVIRSRQQSFSSTVGFVKIGARWSLNSLSVSSGTLVRRLSCWYQSLAANFLPTAKISGTSLRLRSGFVSSSVSIFQASVQPLCAQYIDWTDRCLL